MEESHTFVEKTGRWKLSVKSTFLAECNGKPEDFDVYEITVNKGLARFLHNEKGPAIVDMHNTNNVEYWMNGERISEDEAKKLIHNSKFNDKLQNEILKD